MPAPHRKSTNVAIFILALMLAFPTIGFVAPEVVLAQSDSPIQVVPDCDSTQRTCNTYEFGDEWAANPETTMEGAGGYFALIHQALAETSYTYMETPWVTNHIPDNEALIQEFAFVLLSGFGEVSPAPVATGTLDDGTSWHAYNVTSAGGSYGALVTADTSDPSQNDVVTFLVSPASTFGPAIDAVQAGIRVNGVSPLAGIDSAQVTTGLAEGAIDAPASGTTPTSEITSTPVPPISTTPTAPSTAAAPSAQLDQTMPVGTDTISYNSAEWQLDPENSSERNPAFQRSSDPRVIFSYGQGSDVETGGDVAIALEFLDASIPADAQNVQQVASEILPSGRAYVLYTWEREGAAEVGLFIVDVTSTPGTLRVQALLAPPDQFAPSLALAQRSFLINGEPAFSELDPAALAALLAGGAAPTTTPVTVPTTAPTPTSGSSGFTDSPRTQLTGIPATTPATQTTPTLESGNAPVIVAGATITYGGNWTYDTENSTPDQLAYFDNDALGWGFFGYRTYGESTGDPQAALRTFNEAYLTTIEATNQQLIAEEVLPGGQAWALYTLDFVGQSVAFLTYTDVATPGQVPIQWIFTDVAALSATLADAQINLHINGVPVFSGLDPIAISTLLDG